MEKIEYNFTLKRTIKPSDNDYIDSLKIYNETTPAEN